MPLYEYECNSCETLVEALVRSEQDHLEQESSRCGGCGHQGMHRVISVPASPAVKSGSSLPMAGESCGMPKCCGGGCQM